METLAQMISYDEMSDTLQIYETAHVEDSPSYSHRGVLLDTSRNFISKKVNSIEALPEAQRTQGIDFLT